MRKEIEVTIDDREIMMTKNTRGFIELLARRVAPDLFVGVKNRKRHPDSNKVVYLCIVEEAP